ncbi:hypothetical protein O0L34_g15253 [Tuta absoluta]|nr:hypothetical protein O0L34_g15253 [Tuta absoluta]
MSSSTYYVVEFLGSPPRPDVDKYVCVPGTWLQRVYKPSSSVSVAYPEGHPTRIEVLARMNLSNPDLWMAYEASVKYYANSYEQAETYLMALRKRASSTIELNASTSRRRSFEGSSRPTATMSNSTSTAYNQPLLGNASTRVPTPQTRPQQLMQSSADRAYHSRVPGVSQHINPRTSMCDVQATRNVSNSCQSPGARTDPACCATNLDAVLGSIQANLQKLVTDLNHQASVNERNNEKLIEFGAWVSDYQTWKRSVESQLSERSPMSGMSRKIKAEIIIIEDDDENDVNHGNSTIPNRVIPTCTPRRVEQKRMAQFTLPPEYDRNDSRWTLKYRYPGKTLTELILHSRIYVNSKELRRSLASATNYKTLTRSLMMEVFSENALIVCSFTGARCPWYSRDSPVRPGLDVNARHTVVKYIQKYGEQKRWHIPGDHAIIQSMTIKLHDCRRKGRIHYKGRPYRNN